MPGANYCSVAVNKILYKTSLMQKDLFGLTASRSSIPSPQGRHGGAALIWEAGGVHITVNQEAERVAGIGYNFQRSTPRE